MKKRKKNNIKFSKMIILASLFLFVLMIARLSQLALASTIDGIDLQHLSRQRTMRTEVLPARRGSIFSNDGEALAQNVSSFRLIAYLSETRTDNPDRPQHVVDKKHTAYQLSTILDMEEEEIYRLLNRDVFQTEFGLAGRNLNELRKREIEALELPGISFIQTYRRYYPKGNFLSYSLGYARTITEQIEERQTEVIRGEMGIELYFDQILSGEDGFRTFQRDLRGYRIADTPEIRMEAIEGKDIYLTIDSSIQFFVENALSNAAQVGYEWMHITIADANDGSILATATAPAFDPNRRDMVNFLDTLVSVPFEPGSTMKTFTYMAAMEHGLYNGNATFRSGTFTTSDGTEIGDWNRDGWGHITFDRGFALSSNVGIINIINSGMNATMLRQYFQKLGFGQRTGITLPNESSGNLEFRFETEIFNAGFGQGITTTPIQNIQAMTPLTNDGMLLRPFIVDRIVNPETGEIISQNTREERERVASTQTVQHINRLMDMTVNEPGNTGYHYRLESGELIGKTGTAQIPNPRGGGYLLGREEVIVSFSGIYPKSNPEIIIYAAVKRPAGGSQTVLSNAVRDIVDNVSLHYGHDHLGYIEELVEYTLPSFSNQDPNMMRTRLETLGIQTTILGEGSRVIRQYPPRGSIVTNRDTVFLITNDPNLTVPDVMGLSSTVARELLRTLGINVHLENRGFVVYQNIPPGVPITPDMTVTLVLEPRFDSS